MLQDALKVLDSDVDMAATLFTRWLTMKSEQPVVEVSLTRAQFKLLMERLYSCLKQEFQHLALTV